MSFSSNKTAPNNVSIDSSQTLSNKTLDGTTVIEDGATITSPDIISPDRLDVKKDTFANLSTYASTATDGQLCFATDTKQMFQVVDSALTEVGSGSGGINYIENPDFDNDLTGWATTSVLSGMSITRDTVNPLRGSGSLQILVGNNGTTGEQVYTDFTIDPADLAKKLTISLDFKDISSYIDDGLQIKIIKDPSGSPVEIPVNGDLLAGSSYTHYAQFQTDATELNYRLVIEQVYSGGSGGQLVNIDNVSVGPTNLAFGAIVTDTENINVTVTNLPGTVTSAKAYRVGDRLVGDILFTANGAATGGISLSLDDYTIDMTENWTVEATAIIGGGIHLGSAFNVGGSWTFYGDDGGTTQWSATQPATWASGSKLAFKFDAKISGWSSNAKMSEDLGGREHVTEISETMSQVVTDNTVAKLAFTSGANVLNNTVAAWDTSNLRINIVETGYYDLFGLVSFGAGVDDDGNAGVSFQVNGATVSSGGNIIGATAGNTNSISHTKPAQKLNKGDYVELYCYWNDVVSTSSVTVTGAGFSVAKRSSPQTILETETVAARYTSESGQNVPNNSFTTVLYGDKDFDTHNAYNTGTGIYTAPASGVYSVNAAAIWNVDMVFSTTIVEIAIHVNGAEVQKARNSAMVGGTSLRHRRAVEDTLQLSKGDEVEIVVVQNSGADKALDGSTDKYNIFSIARIK